MSTFDKDLDISEIAHACLDEGDPHGYILVFLQQIRDELRQLHKDNLDKLQVAKERLPAPQPTVKPEPKQIGIEQEPQKKRGTTDVEKVVPKDLRDMVYYEVEDDYILVKPKGYLGSDNFRKLIKPLKEFLDAEYVSAGRDSHIRIPRRQ